MSEYVDFLAAYRGGSYGYPHTFGLVSCIACDLIRGFHTMWIAFFPIDTIKKTERPMSLRQQVSSTILGHPEDTVSVHIHEMGGAIYSLACSPHDTIQTMS